MVLNLSRNDFSKAFKESMVPGFIEVNQVKALSDNVLEKALVIRLMADLYR